MATKISRLPPLPSVSDLVRMYKLRARKQLSQNFLMDMNITNKIVKAAGKGLEGAHVCEVGPGPGGITRSILNAGAAQVVVIEKDSRFFPGLKMLAEASDNRMRIFHGDVLRFDMSEIFPPEMRVAWPENPPKLHIIGNLPFSVSTPLIIKWLHNISEQSGAWSYGRTRLTLTFQKEVAERMAAPMLDSQRCRLSVMCQYLCHVYHKFSIRGKNFVPPPEVDVGVVHLIPRVRPLIPLPFKLVEKVVRQVFHFRRKMCKRGVETLFPPDKPELTEEMFVLADVEPQTRSYQLSIEEIRDLCQAYKIICDKNPGLFEYDYRTKENAAEWRAKKLPLTV